MNAGDTRSPVSAPGVRRFRLPAYTFRRPPGIPKAFEQNDGCVDFGTYCITVLLGPFEKGKSVGGETVYPLRNVSLGFPTKPRGLALAVSEPKDKPEIVRGF